MPLPRMRSARRAAAEIRAMDPGTCITESAIRRAMKRGEIRWVPNESKALVDLDEVLSFFASKDGRQGVQAEEPSTGGIRRVSP